MFFSFLLRFIIFLEALIMSMSNKIKSPGQLEKMGSEHNHFVFDNSVKHVSHFG